MHKSIVILLKNIKHESVRKEECFLYFFSNLSCFFLRVILMLALRLIVRVFSCKYLLHLSEIYSKCLSLHFFLSSIQSLK